MVEGSQTDTTYTYLTLPEDRAEPNIENADGGQGANQHFTSAILQLKTWTDARLHRD